MFLRQHKLIQLADVDHYGRWCNLVVLGSCHVPMYFAFLFAVHVSVYLVQLMQVTTEFLTPLIVLHLKVQISSDELLCNDDICAR